MKLPTGRMIQLGSRERERCDEGGSSTPRERKLTPRKKQEHRRVKERVCDSDFAQFCSLAISDITLFAGGASICWQRLPPDFKANYRSK